MSTNKLAKALKNTLTKPVSEGAKHKRTRPDADPLDKSARLTMRMLPRDVAIVDSIRRSAPGKIISQSDAVRIAIRLAETVAPATLWTLAAEIEMEDKRRL